MGWGGCLFEVGANSRLGAYSNKYGSPLQFETRQFSTLKKGSRETKTTKLGVQTRVLFQIESSSV